MVFTVEGAKAFPAASVTVPDVGLTERADLQEWVINHPEILGPGIKVVTFEFDRWWSSGGNPLDCLDILGLDRAGRLVVAELKRDVALETTEMQAIKYAAMVSRFTPDVLAAQHAKFLSQRNETISDDEALLRLEGHTNNKTLTAEGLRQPRLVLLAAAGFPPILTATAVWLREMGIDITLMLRTAVWRSHLVWGSGSRRLTSSTSSPLPTKRPSAVPQTGAGSASLTAVTVHYLEGTPEAHGTNSSLTRSPRRSAALEGAPHLDDVV